MAAHTDNLQPDVVILIILVRIWSLKPLRWAVSMGRVSDEPGKKYLFAKLDRPTTNQSIAIFCLLKTNSTQALFGDVVDYVTVDHLSIIV